LIFANPFEIPQAQLPRRWRQRRLLFWTHPALALGRY
jgi:hypothetical protein